MRTNKTGNSQFFSDFKSGMPIYRRMLIVGMLLVITGSVAAVIYPMYLKVFVFESMKASTPTEMFENAAKGAELLQTAKMGCIIGGIILCIGLICVPKHYGALLGLYWIKKNNVEYKKYFKTSGKCVGGDTWMISAAYLHAFPQEKSKEYIKTAAVVILILVGIVILSIGAETSFANALDAYKLEAELAKEAFENHISMKLSVAQSKTGFILELVGIAIFAIGIIIDSLFWGKQKKLAWRDEIVKENVQAQ